jgi:hypothetical protein
MLTPKVSIYRRAYLCGSIGVRARLVSASGERGTALVSVQGARRHGRLMDNRREWLSHSISRAVAWELEVGSGSGRCCELVKPTECSARALITLTTMGSGNGVASEKFVRAPTFQWRFRGFSKKDRQALSGPGDNPFGDRVFRSLTRALGRIVRSTAEQEIQVPRER